mmetsp:Transcript_51544/g.167273  ORF Transcript_51544/g.167273 Transcript_51544/m.167273 type:complete len:219 (+) Transcript_51544:2319-2975(+)
MLSHWRLAIQGEGRWRHGVCTHLGSGIPGIRCQQRRRRQIRRRWKVPVRQLRRLQCDLHMLVAVAFVRRPPRRRTGRHIGSESAGPGRVPGLQLRGRGHLLGEASIVEADLPAEPPAIQDRVRRRLAHEGRAGWRHGRLLLPAQKAGHRGLRGARRVVVRRLKERKFDHGRPRRLHPHLRRGAPAEGQLRRRDLAVHEGVRHLLDPCSFTLQCLRELQ